MRPGDPQVEGDLASRIVGYYARIVVVREVARVVVERFYFVDCFLCVYVSVLGDPDVNTNP